MKTIKIVFIRTPNIPIETALHFKSYTFNSQDNLKIGDVLEAKAYGMYLMVVEVSEDGGSFSEQFEIKELTQTYVDRKSCVYSLYKKEA